MDSAQRTPPTLQLLCEEQLHATFTSMAVVEASCSEQRRALIARKDALLIELATVREALEELSGCARRVGQAREVLVEDVADVIGGSAARRLAWLVAPPAAAAASEDAVPSDSLLPTETSPGDETARGQRFVSSRQAATARSHTPTGAQPGASACELGAPSLGSGWCHGGIPPVEPFAHDTKRGTESANAHLSVSGRSVGCGGGAPVPLESDASPRVGGTSRVAPSAAVAPALQSAPAAASAVAAAAFTTTAPAACPAPAAACTTSAACTVAASASAVHATASTVAAAASPAPASSHARSGDPAPPAVPAAASAVDAASATVPAAASTIPASSPARSGDPASSGRSLESKLYWALRRLPRPRPSDKELRESFAFFQKTCQFGMGKELLLDVCGSHGVLAALFLAHGRVGRAVVLDKFKPASFGHVREALAPFWGEAEPGKAPNHGGGGCGASSGCGCGGEDGSAGASGCGAGGSGAGVDPPAGQCCACDPADRLSFLTCDMRAGLPSLLDSEGDPSRVLVVGVHCCNQLTDDLIRICTERGVDFAVMPCCQVGDKACPTSTDLTLGRHAARVGASNAYPASTDVTLWCRAAWYSRMGERLTHPHGCTARLSPLLGFGAALFSPRTTPGPSPPVWLPSLSRCPPPCLPCVAPAARQPHLQPDEDHQLLPSTRRAGGHRCGTLRRNHHQRVRRALPHHPRLHLARESDPRRPGAGLRRAGPAAVTAGRQGR